MKMKKKLNYIFLILLTVLPIQKGLCYDDESTHQDLSNASLKISSTNQRLTEGLNVPDGIDTVFSFKPNMRIIDYIAKGSELEDDPDCRASNHFHDPLKVWTQSLLTDSRWPHLACVKGWPEIDRRSNITWATGFFDYSDSSPFSVKDPYDGEQYVRYDWDTARGYYYSSLIATTEVYREYFLGETFKTLGHVIHLLQDVSIAFA